MRFADYFSSFATTAPRRKLGESITRPYVKHLFNDPLELPEKRHDKILCLDLDETLIHSSTFRLDRAPFLHFDGYFVYKRPHVCDFLREVFSLFDIFIFTSSEKSYADTILKSLCPYIGERYRRYSGSCDFVNGRLRKNIGNFNRGLNKVILVDDNREVQSFYPENVILLDPWTGRRDDNVLMESLLPLLQRCEEEPDVRPVIRSRPKIAL
jgi:Dullard-like phosphatase family protein